MLDYLKNKLLNYINLSDKLLAYKVAELLALTTSFGVRSLHTLDTRFMVKTSEKYVFKFHKLYKSWAQDQKPTTLEFAAFFSRQLSLRCVSFE